MTNWKVIWANFRLSYKSDINFQLVQDTTNKTVEVTYEEYGKKTAINVVDKALYPRAFEEDKDNIVRDTKILLELIRSYLWSLLLELKWDCPISQPDYWIFHLAPILNVYTDDNAKRKKMINPSLIACTPDAIFKCFNILVERLEVKVPEVKTEQRIFYDLFKLTQFLKKDLDVIINTTNVENPKVFEIHVHRGNAICYVMQLDYEGIYKLRECCKVPIPIVTSDLCKMIYAMNKYIALLVGISET
ncbi:unnamed protein product [Rhizophagus irregularis]|nr:unnamed protein product [Rhizophagus irregularis]